MPTAHEQAEAAALDLIRRINREGAITLVEAAEILGPSKRGGKPRRKGSVLRYVTEGVFGVRLEAYHGLAGWVTSAAALERFVARVHRAKLGQVAAEDTSAQDEADRKERAEQAKAELETLARGAGRKRKGDSKEG